MDAAWSFEHSITCSVSKEFAWRFWTDVRNWAIDADVETVTIDGPFVAGTLGVTQSRSSGRLEWRIAEVEPGRATLEFPIPGVAARFEWSFADDGGGVRITQRASISGEQAAQLAGSFGPMLEAGIPAGMRRLCQAMEAA